MSSLIGNEVKTNICLEFLLLFIVRTISCAAVRTSTTITTTIIACSLFSSAYTLCVSTNTCSLDLYNRDL